MEHPDPDRLALAALPAEPPDPEVVAHLAVCGPCREHVETLRAMAGGTDGDVRAPPDRVWQAIVDELDAEAALSGRIPAPRHAVRPAPALRSRRPRRRLGAAVGAVAGLVVGVAGGLGLGPVLFPPAPSGPTVAQLAPVGNADPAGHGTVESVRQNGGRLLVVRLAGVSNTEGADYLEAWLMDPTGARLLALGSLAQDGTTFTGEFTVPADLPTAGFGVVDISAEKWDGNPGHSRVSLLRGPLA